MASAGTPLELSARFVQVCSGLSLDADKGFVRVAYRSKQDVKDYETAKDKSRNKIRLQSFSDAEVDAIIKFLSENAELPTEGEIQVTDSVPDDVIQACKKELNLGCRVLNNQSCKAGAQQYVFQHVPTKSLRQQELFSDRDWNAMTEFKDEFLKTTAVFLKTTSQWAIFADKYEVYKEFLMIETGRKVPKKEKVELLPGELPGLAEMEDSASYFPCLLVDVGDTTTYTKVNHVFEKFEVLDRNAVGMDSMLGLASLLIGINSYDELIDLAEKGKYSVIHASMEAEKATMSGKQADDDVDFYNSLNVDLDKYDKPYILFCFGLALGKSLDDFKKEDMALAIVHHFIFDIVNKLLPLVMPGSGVNHVMASGKMFERHLVGDVFMNYWYNAASNVAMFGGESLRVKGDVLTLGQYLGAIGALVNTVEPFTGLEQ